MNVNRSSGRGSDREQVEAFLNELSSVAIRLKQLSAGLEDSATAAAAPTARALLRLLEKFGPQTVPQLARNRATSRQNIQVIVNRLLVDGYVEMLDNPAHQRSRLVCISSKGAKFLEASVDPWDRTLEQLATKLPGQAISDAAGLLS